MKSDPETLVVIDNTTREWSSEKTEEMVVIDDRTSEWSFHSSLQDSLFKAPVMIDTFRVKHKRVHFYMKCPICIQYHWFAISPG